MLRLAGKSVLITGSTSGLGFAAAEGFAREGAAVIVNGRDEDRIEHACSRLQEAVPGASVRGIAADVDTVQGVERLIDLAPDVDVLVNNAGIFSSKPFEDTPEEECLQVFEVNVMSGVRLSCHHLGRMLACNERRKIFVFSTGRPSSQLERDAEPNDIANLINYIASPLAAATKMVPR
jgi:NAD(P)-dependent dehydrogenase (short-subunit alcohol dehydrogenase family)